MNIPFFAITYALAGAIAIAVGLREQKLRSLGGLAVILGVLNRYVEEWPQLKQIDFELVSTLLLVVFMWPYTVLSIALTGHRVASRPLMRGFISSFLPAVYAITLGLIATLALMKTFESPPLALYIFLVFIVVIHVPGFAAGRNRDPKGPSQLVQAADHRHSGLLASIKMPLVTLGPPLAVILLIQLTLRADWRLFGSNAVMTAAITSLFALGRAGPAVPGSGIEPGSSFSSF